MIGFFMVLFQMIGRGFKRVSLAMRQRFAQWLLRDVRLLEQKFGANTITLSPSTTDVVRWSATQAATALGDLGMDKTSGKPQCFANDVGGGGASNRALAIEDDVVLVDGSNAMIGALNMNNNRITSVPTTPTATSDAVNQSYVDSKVSGLKWLAPAVVSGYVGNATVATLDALSPVAGDAYVVTDSGTLTRGTLAVAAGDFVQDDGTNWNKIVTNSGGFVPSGTRALINSTTALISPLTDATDDNKVAVFSGTSNTPTFATGVPDDGQAILVDGEGDTRENRQYVFDGVGASGSWIQFGGVGMAHGSLSGLTSGDAGHTQFAMLAGRAGGQTLQGGTAASQNLTLESTANPTKGNVLLASGTDFQLSGNDEIRPGTDGQGKVGTASLRFAEVHGVTVVSGDHVFKSSERGAEWVLSEEKNRLLLYNRVTKKCYSMLMIPVRKPDFLS